MMGGLAGVGRGDVDCASRQRGGEHSRDGGAVVAVCGSVAEVVWLVAEVAAHAEEFNSGPLLGEGGQVGQCSLEKDERSDCGILSHATLPL